MPKTNGSITEEAKRVFGAAARHYERLTHERQALTIKLSEIDALLAQLPAEAQRGAGNGAPPAKRRGRPAKQATQVTAGRRRGRPAKAAGTEGTPKRGRPPKASNAPAGARTFREVVVAELGKGKPLSLAEITTVVRAERPDIKPKYISPMIAQLKKAGVLKSSGQPRSFQYSLA